MYFSISMKTENVSQATFKLLHKTLLSDIFSDNSEKFFVHTMLYREVCVGGIAIEPRLDMCSVQQDLYNHFLYSSFIK